MKPDAITSRILEDARAEASAMQREADRRVDKLRRENDDAMRKQREKAIAKAGEDAVEIRDRMLRMAELDQRKEYLGMKRQVIDAAFDRALDEMRKMPAEQARTFMAARITEAAQGDEEVIFSAGDEGIYTAEFLKELNAGLTKAGKPGALRLAQERRELNGGVLLRRGGMEINLTYAAILGEKRPALEAEVASMLFD